jgi:glycylpeptide N-tetradecanoyltransferase
MHGIESHILYWLLQSPTGEITDFISFYLLPSTIIGNATYNALYAAYSYYNVSTATPWKVLMNDALILAQKAGCDVFNALDLMDNSKFLSDLKFGAGDGSLHYYFYNWQCPSLKSADVGLVLM